MSYTITNLTLVAIRSPKGFKISQHIAEKRGTLLFQGIFGHTVVDLRLREISPPDAESSNLGTEVLMISIDNLLFQSSQENLPTLPQVQIEQCHQGIRRLGSEIMPVFSALHCVA